MPFFPLPMPKWGNGGESAVGAALAGGKVYTYAGGTSTPLATYTDYTGGTPNANPVVLDADGRANIFVEDGVSYKITLKTSADVELWTVDGVSVPQIEPTPAAANVPTGAILPYGASVAPSGYLLCDGSAVSRTTYSALFAIVSTAYGAGNGTTTFNLPDFRGRFPLGVAAAGTGSTLGATGGAIDHTHTGPSHTHTVASHTHTIAHTHTVSRTGWGGLQTVGPEAAGRLQTTDGALTNLSTAQNDLAATGASSAANSGGTALTTDAGGTGNTGTANPPFLTCYYIIKT